MQDKLAQQTETPHRAGYRLEVAAADARIRVSVAGQTIADSDRAIVMRETRYAPVYYFPREDVAMHLLSPTSHRTHCPFKGDASYWTLAAGNRQIENFAWSYETPYDEAATIKDYMAFFWDKADAWYADGEPMPHPQPAGDAPPNPFIQWLIADAWRAASIPDFVSGFAATLASAGLPLWRMRLLIQTRNPLLFATGYTWQRDIDGIAEFQATHAGLQKPQYRDSPFARIIEGEGGIRRRLSGPGAELDFPVLHELAKQGATDYVAMPMKFSDGQVNILVLVSDSADGFTTAQLGQVYEILPNLSRLLEAHAQRHSALSLLQTYLGRSAGSLVMDGRVKRGDADELDAIIMLSDLRDSTTLAETLAKQDYLSALNDYYDCVAGAAIDNGGEVLKFIGDAVLAIFPITPPEPRTLQTGSHASAYDDVLAAVTDALQRRDLINAERQAGGLPPLRFGTGLHCGTVTFGNVGTPGRLDFTVIGPGVNQTARIAELCKTLGEDVIMSGAVAANTGVATISLGTHQLRGSLETQELFTLPRSQ